MARFDRDDDLEDDRPRRRRRRDDIRDRRGGGGGKSALTIVAICGGLLLFCGVGSVLLLPAVAKVRGAAARSTEMNSFKLIGLGMHQYASVHNNRLPPADGDLSWRVHILPFIEQDDAYRRFDTNVPWDHERNRAASQAIIKYYVSPLDHGSDQTRCRTFVGDGTAHDTKLWNRPFPNFITDGTANTLMMIDTADMVPWAAPMEITVGGQFPEFGNPKRSQALLLLWDGSVRPVEKSKLSASKVRALATAAGNDQVPADW